MELPTGICQALFDESQSIKLVKSQNIGTNRDVMVKCVNPQQNESGDIVRFLKFKNYRF